MEGVSQKLILTIREGGGGLKLPKLNKGYFWIAPYRILLNSAQLYSTLNVIKPSLNEAKMNWVVAIHFQCLEGCKDCPNINSVCIVLRPRVILYYLLAINPMHFHVTIICTSFFLRFLIWNWLRSTNCLITIFWSSSCVIAGFGFNWEVRL